MTIQLKKMKHAINKAVRNGSQHVYTYDMEGSYSLSPESGHIFILLITCPDTDINENFLGTVSL